MTLKALKLPTSLKHLVTAKTDDEKTKNTFDANFIEQIHKARFEKRLTKTQVEKTIEEDSALDSVRNLSITQDEVGAGHQEDTSLSMEEEKEEVSLSPNKEASRLQHQPQTTTSKTTIVQTNIDNSTTTNGESAASTPPTLQYPERRNTTTRRSLTQFHNNWIL